MQAELAVNMQRANASNKMRGALIGAAGNMFAPAFGEGGFFGR